MASSELSRAQGCMMGQIAGDALGGLVEFQSAAVIKSRYPDGLREMHDGGTWSTLAGQPTDDSEMALALARSLLRVGEYDSKDVRAAYVSWLSSEPFACGSTIASGLRGRLQHGSQANGAMMRVSPLGIFGAKRLPEQLVGWACADAALTHPHPVCTQANALFALALAHAIRSGGAPAQVYSYIVTAADELDVDATLREVIEAAGARPPGDYLTQQGWVLIAFQNALWQLLHAANPERGIIDTVMRGGDTDTNAAICGALLGAVHGLDALPDQWVRTVTNCRPEAGVAGVLQPRPREYWPSDALELAARLTGAVSESDKLILCGN